MDENKKMISRVTAKNKNGIEVATFGAGCFWCIEVIYQQLRGVIEVIPGYCGGFVQNPTYFQVCQGNTGHAEACQVIYNSNVISYEELLEIFWLIHDPTSLNNQEYDIGPQYKSVIFYHNKEQEASSKEYKIMLNSSGEYTSTIVTEILPLTNFYKAEDCNINYYYLNAKTPYSLYVIAPKVKKFKKVFNDKLKSAAEFN
jgi:peptide-methionine (S)-S-oxide reductase